MTTSDETQLLRLAIVVATSEDACTAVTDGERVDVEYAPFFPRPRPERVAPGHLVALAAGPEGGDRVVWRWFDTVVLGNAGSQFRLWEPGHGEVLAQLRPAAASPDPGSRAYASAGLPGADWWLAGPAVSRAGLAEVDVEELGRFLTDNGLWYKIN